MGFHAFRSGCNALCYHKNNINYGMICAWATMLDYSTIGMLIGSQSVTGANMEVNDLVGVSALSMSQKEIAVQLGENHSHEIDKFKNIDISREKSAILIQNAKNLMVCRVSKIVKMNEENDLFITMQIESKETHIEKEFLPLESVLPE